MTSRMIPAIMPESRVLPPEFMFTTVRMVAPAPGIPPKMAAMLFPIPWPTSSLLGLCLVLVMLSATTEVSRESMAPSKDRVRAVKI